MTRTSWAPHMVMASSTLLASAGSCTNCFWHKFHVALLLFGAVIRQWNSEHVSNIFLVHILTLLNAVRSNMGRCIWTTILLAGPFRKPLRQTMASGIASLQEQQQNMWMRSASGPRYSHPGVDRTVSLNEPYKPCTDSPNTPYSTI